MSQRSECMWEYWWWQLLHCFCHGELRPWILLNKKIQRNLSRVSSSVCGNLPDAPSLKRKRQKRTTLLCNSRAPIVADIDWPCMLLWRLQLEIHTKVKHVQTTTASVANKVKGTVNVCSESLNCWGYYGIPGTGKLGFYPS